MTWRWCFYINLPVGGLSALIMLVSFQTPRAAKPAPATLKEKFLQMDVIGSALIMGAIITYILAFQYGGQTRPWNDSVVISLIGWFAVISVVFIMWEFVNSHNDRAMVPPRLLRDRQIWSISLFTFFNAGTFFLSIYLLPIYFQSIGGVSPIESGVHNLPFIIALVVGTSLSGVAIGATGIATPWLPFGAVMATVATGLFYTLDIDTTGKWIGYQILAGFGWGISFQIPITIGQATAPPEDLAMITATLLCRGTLSPFCCSPSSLLTAQPVINTIGGAIFVSGGQGAFLATMLEKLGSDAPMVNPLLVIATGASEIRQVFSPQLVPGIIESYMAGLKVAFAVLIGGMGMATLATLTCSWKRLDVNAIKEAGGGL